MLENIKSLLENILDEGLDDIRAKYYSDIPEGLFRKLVKIDPTYNENKDKLGTYGKWILNMYKKEKFKEEDFYKITEDLQNFEDNKRKFKNKDINQYKSTRELFIALKDIKDTEEDLSDRQLQRRQKNKSKRLADDMQDEANLVFEDENWEVWVPLTTEASCALGEGTRWCTAANSSYNQFSSYSKQGNLYININKQDPEEKYQFHFETNSFMDSEDSSIDLMDFLGENPDLKKFYSELIDKNFKIVVRNNSKLYYLLENPTEEQTQQFYYSINTNLKIGQDGWLIYENRLDSFLEKVVTSGGRGDYLSEETIYEILSGENNFFQDSEHYESDNFIYKFESIPNIEEYLKSKNLSIDLIKKIMGEDFEDEDLQAYMEANNKEEIDLEGIRQELVYAYTDAREMGSEQEAYGDIKSSLESIFHKFDISNFPKMSIGIKLGEIKDIVTDNDYDVYNEEFLETYTNYMNNGDLVEIQEPQYGWSGFDEESFISRVKEII
jgi:hypothetical protein